MDQKIYPEDEKYKDSYVSDQEANIKIKKYRANERKQHDRDSHLVQAVEGAKLDFKNLDGKDYIIQSIIRGLGKNPKEYSGLAEMKSYIEEQYIAAKERLRK